jgi:argininosuccinate lyase
LKVSANVEEKAAAGFVGATELANMLVRKHNVAFRTAHKIAGALVKSLLDSKQTLLAATPELLQKIAWESAGVKLTVKRGDLTDCTNPRRIVETYKVQGGPAPSEVKKSIKTYSEIMEQTKKNIAKFKNNQDDAKWKLDNVVESYCASNSEKVRFKNPNL